MPIFISFAALAAWIKQNNPSGSFSCLVRPKALSTNNVMQVTWTKGKLNGEFITWAKTGFGYRVDLK